MFAAQRSSCAFGNLKPFGRNRGAWLLLAAIALAGCRESLLPARPTLTGEWIAARDPSRTLFPEADSFRFVLIQTDTLVSGTWSATGPGGVVVRPDQLVSGRVTEGSIQLNLTYSRRDHGCTGPARECYDSYYRVIGEFRGADQVQARVIGIPHPSIPDSELPIFAEWILERQ